jgi:hypothetical protein
MSKFKSGDRVITTSEMPVNATLFLGVGRGEIGVVIKCCECAQNTGLQPTTRVEFDKIITCLFDTWLEKLPDAPEQDKMVDWSQVPKPWEIGVKG